MGPLARRRSANLVVAGGEGVGEAGVVSVTVGETVGVGDIVGAVGEVVTLTRLEWVGAGVTTRLGAVAMGAPAGIVAAGALWSPDTPALVPCT
jgi:hypothetical protein